MYVWASSMASMSLVFSVVTMGMSFAVVSLAGAAVACQPSRHQVRSSRGRSLSQRGGTSASSGSGRTETVRRKSRMRATCKHRGSSGWSSRGKLMRAGATSRMTCPWVSVLNGTKVPTSEKEVRSRDFLSLPDRNFVLVQTGHKKSGKKGKRGKRPRRDRPIWYRKKPSQEDDHGCIGPIIRSMEPTSQGAISITSCVSAENHCLMCSRNDRVRDGCDAAHSRNIVGELRR